MRRECTFQKFDASKQIVYGIVYEPFKADAHGDWATAANVENWAHSVLSEGAVIDTDHDQVENGSRIVESFIARKGDSLFPEGSWAVGVKTPDHVWDKIQAKELNGFSFYGTGNRIPKSLPGDPAAKHEITDLEISSVSLVKKAANKRNFAFAKGDDMNNPMAQILTALETLNTGLKKFAESQAAMSTRIDEALQPRDRQNLTKAQAEVFARNGARIAEHRSRIVALQSELEKLWAGEAPEHVGMTERELRREIAKSEVDLRSLGVDTSYGGFDDPGRSAFFQRGGVSNFLVASDSYRDDDFGVRTRRNAALQKAEDAIEVENCLII